MLQDWQIARRALQLSGAVSSPSVEPPPHLIEVALTEMLILLDEASHNYSMPFLTTNGEELGLEEDIQEYDLSDLSTPIQFVSSVLLRDSDGNDVPLSLMTTQEWDRLPEKSKAGPPERCVVVRGPDSAVLKVHPIPEDNESYLVINGKRFIADPSSEYGSSSPDLPPAWSNWLSYATAASLVDIGAGDFQKSAILTAKAASMLHDLKSAIGRTEGLKGFVAYRDV